MQHNISNLFAKQIALATVAKSVLPSASCEFADHTLHFLKLGRQDMLYQTTY